MESLLSNLHSIVRLAIKQPLLSVGAIIGIAFAVGADTTTFRDLNVFLSRSITYAEPATQPAIISEAVPEMGPSALVVPPRPLEAADQQSHVPAPASPKACSFNSATKTRDRARDGTGAPLIAASGHSRPAVNQPSGLTIDLRLIPAVAVQRVQNLQAPRWNRKSSSTREAAAVTIIGPEVSKLIADRTKMEQAEVELEKSDSATARKWKMKARADLDALARRFSSLPVPVRVSHPVQSSDGSQGGR